MINLLSANLKRLIRNKAFISAVVFTAASALFEISMIYQDYLNYGGSPYFDSALFSYATVGVIVLSAAVPLFLGIEFSDGTLRNKVVVGQSRSSIYFSMLLTSFVIELSLILTWSLFYIIPGLILLKSGNPFWVYLVLYLAMIMEMAVFSGIFTLITMAIGNKAIAAVLCIILSLALFVHAAVIDSVLNQSEYIAPGFVISADGSVEMSGDLELNPNYIPEGSPKRVFYNFLMDFMPGGQAIQVSSHNIGNLYKIYLYDVVWLAVLATGGAIIFKRKDLK
ncbi:MAG: hypothetical protein ACI4WM_08755 [Erysipelotrichaceae bacterium]